MDECKNYQPISLMQIDVKIIIHGRSPSNNIRRLVDIMWSMTDTQSPVAAISLDGEKAFDMVEWGFLFKILEEFGFGTT